MFPNKKFKNKDDFNIDINKKGKNLATIEIPNRSPLIFERGKSVKKCSSLSKIINNSKL